MTPIEFPEQNVVIAANQPQYRPLPSHIGSDGRVTFCWRFSWKERLRLLLTGVLWHQVLTHRNSLQPQKLSLSKPEMV